MVTLPLKLPTSNLSALLMPLLTEIGQGCAATGELMGKCDTADKTRIRLDYKYIFVTILRNPLLR